MKSPLAGHGYSVTRLKTTCPRRNVLVSLNEQKWVILGECRGGRSQSRRRLGLATRESPVEHWRSWCPALRCCHPKYRHSRDGVRRPRGRTNWPRCRAVDRRISGCVAESMGEIAEKKPLPVEECESGTVCSEACRCRPRGLRPRTPGIYRFHARMLVLHGRNLN